MTDELDNALRDALRADTDGVEAGPDLLVRVRSASRPEPRHELLAIVAAILAIAVIAVGLVLASRDGDEALDVVDDPSTTTTARATPVVCTVDAVGYPPCGDDDTIDSPRPNLIALVREDGWLVTVDLETGEEHELVDGGRPDERDEIGMAYYIESVELSPEGRWVYYVVCCEPAGGQTYRLPSDGSGTEPEPGMSGYHPRFRPDGNAIATWGGGYGLLVQGTDGTWIEQPDSWDERPPDWMSEMTTDLSWSPDGSMVALATVDPDSLSRRRVHYFAADGTGDGVTPLAYGNEVQDDTRPFPLWGTFEQTGGDIGFGPLFRDDVGAARHISQDRSYGWLLWVADDGTLSFTTTLGADRTQLPDLPKARLADW